MALSSRVRPPCTRSYRRPRSRSPPGCPPEAPGRRARPACQRVRRAGRRARDSWRPRHRSRSRNATSSGNDMPIMCTARQGRRISPSPAPEPARPMQTAKPEPPAVGERRSVSPRVLPRAGFSARTIRITRTLASACMIWITRRSQDDHEHRREDAEDERKDQLDRGLGRRLLGPLTPLGAHGVGVDPQRLRNRSAEPVGLDQHGHQRADVLEPGAVGQVAQAPLRGRCRRGSPG